MLNSEQFDTAQVCLNGHIVNPALHLRPERSRKHCEACGEQTISQCPSCQQDIRGAQYQMRTSYSEARFGKSHPEFFQYSLPPYCSECGQPYPWTVKKIELAKLRIDAELSNMSEQDRAALKEGVPALTTQHPGEQTQKLIQYMFSLCSKYPNDVRALLISILGNLATDKVRALIDSFSR